MKTLIAFSLVAAFMPTLAAALSRPEPVRERRHCTQISARAGSHMPGRRICLTETQWQEALGPQWRRRLADSADIQSEIEAMWARMTPDGETHGVRPQHSYGAPSSD